MRKLLALFLVLGCADPAPDPLDLQVSLVHDRDAEARTRDQLLRLVRAHPEIEPWIRTRTIAVDDTCIPHSHPVLTLHARHLDDDDLLLSTFLHEQIHWHLEAHPAETAAAVADLRVLFPQLPVGFPDGADSEQSSYEHLIVNHLEQVAMRRARGPEVTRRVFAFWRGDHYRTLYEIVIEHEDAIARVVAQHALELPAPQAE